MREKEQRDKNTDAAYSKVNKKAADISDSLFGYVREYNPGTSAYEHNNSQDNKSNISNLYVGFNYIPLCF